MSIDTSMGLFAKLRRFFCGDDQLKLILQGIEKLESTLMSAISDFAAKQKAHNEKLATSIDGLVADVQSLNDKITELQNNPGPISPEDQATLDELEAQGAALSEKAAALDELTPPVTSPQA